MITMWQPIDMEDELKIYDHDSEVYLVTVSLPTLHCLLHLL